MVVVCRYVSEIYQHASHWRHNGQQLSYEFYQTGKFVKCKVPGHHSCLDELKADGNLQFDTDHTSP